MCIEPRKDYQQTAQTPAPLRQQGETAGIPARARRRQHGDKLDVPYQSLMKLWLAEKLDEAEKQRLQPNDWRRDR